MRRSGHRNRSRFVRTFEPLEDRCLLAANVVINEVHYNPVDPQSLSEFVELHNAGDSAADISDWYMSEGIDFRVPTGTSIPPGGFYVIAENAAAFDAEFNPGDGPFSAYLVPEGTRGLQNFAGALGMDFVVNDSIVVSSLGAFDSQSNGFSRNITVQLWQRDDQGTPSIPGDDTGVSVLAELVFSEDAPGELAGSTRFKNLDVPIGLAPGAYTIVASGYGVGERVLNGGADGAGQVNDGGGRISFVGSSRWGDDSTLFPSTTDVHLHQYGAGSFRFDFESDVQFQSADGEFTGKLSNSGETLTLRDATGKLVDTVTYNPGFPWPTAAAGAGPSMELMNPLFDNDLGGNWRSAADSPVGRPSPGRVNAAFLDNAPPQIRQVRVAPEQPVSDEAVVLTAKVTDPDGVGDVTLAYQVVDPGDYIRQTDARYETDWVTLPMTDDGTGGDSVAGDATFSVTLPAEIQVHRRLVRYRISVSDRLGQAVRVPYAR